MSYAMTREQFDTDYKLLRKQLLKGQISAQVIKNWIKSRGGQVIVSKKQVISVGGRADRDLELLRKIEAEEDKE